MSRNIKNRAGDNKRQYDGSGGYGLYAGNGGSITEVTIHDSTMSDLVIMATNRLTCNDPAGCS